MAAENEAVRPGVVFIAIGDENLRTQQYTNGDTIVDGLNSSEWSSTNEGAVAVYGQMGACYTNSTGFVSVAERLVSGAWA